MESKPPPKPGIYVKNRREDAIWTGMTGAIAWVGAPVFLAALTLGLFVCSLPSFVPAVIVFNVDHQNALAGILSAIPGLPVALYLAWRFCRAVRRIVGAFTVRKAPGYHGLIYGNESPEEFKRNHLAPPTQEHPRGSTTSTYPPTSSSSTQTPRR